jgi:ABC-type lipoprotein export system ATPase subunit
MMLLELEQVSKTYVRGLRTLPVLQDVSLQVHAGDFVAIYGQRNSGKSTLLKVAAGLEVPDQGVARFAGQDLAQLPASELARVRREELGWVARTGPQSREWVMVDYIALPLLYGSRDQANRKALEALDRVGIAECASARWDDLGSAERMLVALAQAIVREPRVLVLDDPTAGLDAVERDRAMSLVRSMADQTGFGVLMAVPDMPSMLRAHDVLSLSRGRLVRAPDDSPDGRGALIDFPRVERSA